MRFGLQRIACVAALFLAGCASSGVMPKRVLDPAGSPRSFAWAQGDAGGVDLSVTGEVFPGDGLLLPVRMTFDVDDQLRPWAEWQPVAWTDRETGGWKSNGSGDLAVGFQQRLNSGGDEDSFAPLVSVNAFAVFPHGGPRPMRWPGIVEGEEGYYGVLMAEFGNMERSVTVNLGAGAGGRVGRQLPTSRFERAPQDGKSGRLFGTLAFTQALPSTGVDFATEPSRVGAEVFWMHDPVDDRDFAELHVGLSFWLGAHEVDLGWRRGLTSETPDDVLYLGVRVRLFDTLAF